MNAIDRPIRRVTVALDAGSDHHTALRQAAELAREMEAELCVVFVEESNLFRLCGLPAREIALGTGTWRQPDTRTLERELKARAVEARAGLERLAQAQRLTWSFQVWRGRMDEALKEAATHADLVTLGRRTRPVAEARPARRASRARPTPAPAPVVAFYEADSAAANRVLNVAARMARSALAPLVVVAPVPSSAAGRRVRAGVEQQLSDAGSVAVWHAIRPTRQSIFRALQDACARLVVIGADGPAVGAGLLDDMLQIANAEGLLVSGTGSS